LERCVEGCLAQGARLGELIVVGRPVDVDARDVVLQAAAQVAVPVRWLTVQQPGYIAPVLTGLRAASSDLVAFVDDDAVPQIGWLEELSRPFEDSSVACVGGQAIGPNDRSAIRSRARDAGKFRWYGRFIGRFGTVCNQRTVAADSVLEGNCVWRRDVLKTLRRDAFFNVGDSLHYGMDLCLEAQAQGWKVLYASRA